MPYQVVAKTSFERDLKQFKKQKPVLEKIKIKVQEIIKDPTIGSYFVGDKWLGFLKLAFHDRPELRIIYIIYPCCLSDTKKETCEFTETPIDEEFICNGLIEFVFVKTREECNNLYYKDKAYIDGFRR